MIKAGVFSLAALWSCSCAIDDRTVEVVPACASPPADGLISDFSTARLGHCSHDTCPGTLASSPVVTLGDPYVPGLVPGLVFPYWKPDTVNLVLGLTGDLAKRSDDASALRVVVHYDAFRSEAPDRVGGIALRFVTCVDGTDFFGVSFRTDGALGTCPLRFAMQFSDDEQGKPCLLGTCPGMLSVAVTTGTTTAAFPGSRSAQANTLFGMQWEFAPPIDSSSNCDADFTIDDIRLVAGP